MKIYFSRHARRRAKLYRIPEQEIEDVLRKIELADGKHEFVKHIRDQNFPIKIIVSVKGEVVSVITNYPLKKGLKK